MHNFVIIFHDLSRSDPPFTILLAGGGNSQQACEQASNSLAVSAMGPPSISTPCDVMNTAAHVTAHNGGGSGTANAATVCTRPRSPPGSHPWPSPALCRFVAFTIISRSAPIGLVHTSLPHFHAVDARIDTFLRLPIPVFSRVSEAVAIAAYSQESAVRARFVPSCYLFVTVHRNTEAADFSCTRFPNTWG